MFLLIGGVALAVLILAAAAYVGAGLLKQRQAAAGGKGGPQMVAEIGGGPGGGAPRQIRIEMTPAKELPQAPSALEGVFTKRQDNSIFLGTGEIKVMVSKGQDGTGSRKASFDGPVVEVVVTHDTQVWQDDTEMLAFEKPPTTDEVKVQQVVSPGSLDELNESSAVTVWGERRGDRVIATALLYKN